MAIYYGDGSNSNSGRVIQVVSSTYTNADVVGSNNSYTAYNNNLSVLITPKETGSKILITCHVMLMTLSSRDSQGIVIFKDGVVFDSMRGQADQSRSRLLSGTYVSDNDNAMPVSGQFLHSPNTTSQVRYTVGLFSHSNSNVAMNRDWNYSI
jgi:hypothetical protein